MNFREQREAISAARLGKEGESGSNVARARRLGQLRSRELTSGARWAIGMEFFVKNFLIRVQK